MDENKKQMKRDEKTETMINEMNIMQKLILLVVVILAVNLVTVLSCKILYAFAPNVTTSIFGSEAYAQLFRERLMFVVTGLLMIPAGALYSSQFTRALANEIREQKSIVKAVSATFRHHYEAPLILTVLAMWIYYGVDLFFNKP